MSNLRPTPAIKVLLILSTSLFFIQLMADTFLGMHLLETLGLVPNLFLEKLYFWQPVTYMFMHAELFHILFNMLLLWMIGSELEAQWGTKEFLRYYFTCGIMSGFFYLAVLSVFQGGQAASIPMIGASGAVYGLLVAYGILYSERQILFMMIFPMKAKHFVLLLAAIEFVSTVFYSRSGIANAAHLGGLLVGFGYLVGKAYFRMKSRQKQNPSNTRRKRPKHLHLVINNEVFKEFDNDDDPDGPPTAH